jgi:endonuclease YncB( thermonuclease family)
MEDETDDGSANGIRDDILRSSMRTARLRYSGLLLAALLLLLAACSPQESPPAPRPPLRPGEAAAGAAAGSVVQARSVRVQDGDSFVARLDDGRRMTIRLSGIDAPEQAQPFAGVSRRNLLRLLGDRALEVRVAKYDQYGRAVAQVFVPAEDGPVDVGLQQLQAGLAWFYDRYRNDLPASSREPYAVVAEAARRAARGLWQAPQAQPPWEFRRRGRDARLPQDGGGEP